MLRTLLVASVVLAPSLSAQQFHWVQSSVNQHWYGVGYRGTSWTAAEALAVVAGGHLATVRDAGEQQWIQTLAPWRLGNGFWLGLRQDPNAPGYSEPAGGFAWVSGETSSFTQWDTGQPNDGCGGEAYVHTHPNWSWNDLDDAAQCTPNGLPQPLVEVHGTPAPGWSWPVSTPTGTGPRYHAVADVDRDGDLDLVVPNYFDDTVSVLANDGTGALTPSATIATSDEPASAVVTDVDQDGFADVVVACHGAGLLEVHLGTPSGYLPGAVYPLGACGVGLATADVDSDGLDDVLVTVPCAHELRVFLNGGSVGLILAQVLPTENVPHFVTVGDLDGDGHPDAVVSNAQSASLGIYLNTGTAGLGPPTHVPAVVPWIGRAALGDLDGDLDLDLAVSSATTAQLAVLRGDGHGGFQLASTEPLPYPSIWVEAAQLAGDSRGDLVVGSYADSTELTVLVPHGASGFGRTTLHGPRQGDSIVVRDIDGNGWPDVTATGHLGDDAVVILGGLPNAAPYAYCTPGISSHACAASMSASGFPSASAAAGFTLRVSGVEGQRTTMFFYGIQATATPWHAGSSSWMCVVPPRQRMVTSNSGGNAGSCDGSVVADWNLWRAAHPVSVGAPFTASQRLFAQAWYRDPGAPSHTNLSDALGFVLGP
jgi:hypothetical protein